MWSLAWYEYVILTYAAVAGIVSLNFLAYDIFVNKEGAWTDIPEYGLAGLLWPLIFYWWLEEHISPKE